MRRSAAISFLVLLAFAFDEWTPSIERYNLFSRGGGDKSRPSMAVKAEGSEIQAGNVIEFEDGIPYAQLPNSNKIPLVGYGVGNLQKEFIPGMISAALKEERKTRLIDTSHASGNERLVAEGIIKGVEKLNVEGKVEVHVVTKVWYTHLGYERTKKSVEDSLGELDPVMKNDKVELKLHLLLHWPRCFDNIPWMDCDEEEKNLPDDIKSVGPNPGDDPETALKGSWKLLEDLYLSDQYPIASIGVSNFHLQDVEALEGFAKIRPHILQVNVWSLLHDSALIDYCHEHRIHIQVYNAMHRTVSRPESAPRAFHHLQKVAYEISSQIGRDLSPAQVVLAWLIQHGVSVIPRTSNVHRLTENSAVSLSNIPAFSETQVETIAHAVEAYLSGEDLAQDIHVSVTFHVVTNNVMLYWVDRDGEETRIAYIPKGGTYNDSTFPNHVFRTYLAASKDVWVDHQIDANFGEHKDIHVEL